MACEATERAKCLINSEGLDVVEHILLRPRCGNDYTCDWITEEKECPDTHCDFQWKIPETGSCEDGKCVAFIPGADPYSFIATVVLPAWPARFRKAENRKQIEDILYREAPAHVMLRTMWLSPLDFCTFEDKFRDWTRWMAGKGICQDDFDICKFLDFLFNQKLECFDPECNVCETDQRKALNDTKELRNFSNQVTEQFCWTKNKCSEDSSDERPNLFDVSVPTAAGTGTAETDLLPPVSLEDPGETNDAKKQPDPQIEKAKMHFINNRLRKYRSSVGKIAGESDHRAVGLADSFVKDPAPTIKRLSEITSAILQGPGAKGKSAGSLSPAQKQDLLQNIISYYLDKSGFNGDAEEKIAALKTVVEALVKAGIDVTEIFNYWASPEIGEYLGMVNEKKIQNIFSVS
jgi:hypothetical protein